tara:strand:- start:1371 stop:1547 length:177 start_codon:yes stop_codon:yes gene_type:complete
MFECFSKEIKINKNNIYISENLLEKIIIKTINSFNYLLDISGNEIHIEMINKQVEIID